MDINRVALVVGIGLVSYYLLLQWPPMGSAAEVPSKELLYEEVVNDSKQLLSKIEPVLEVPESPKIDPVLEAPESSMKPVASYASNEVFQVENDVLSLSVEKQTGAIVLSILKKVSVELKGVEFYRVLDKWGSASYSASSGFFSEETGYIHPNFSEVKKLESTDGASGYVLSGTSQDGGFYITREIILLPGSYAVKITDANSLREDDTPSSVVPYAVIERNSSQVEGGGFAYAYLGPVFSTESERFEKVDFEDLDESVFRKTSLGGWVSLIQHYFVTAWVPDQTKTLLYQARRNGEEGLYSAGYTSRPRVVGLGEEFSFINQLYVGPKISNQLKNTHENLDLVLDYGFLWWLGKPIYWLLNLGFDIFKNWGFAIIFLTVVLKLLLWPLSAAAYKSMGKMRALGPQLQALQSSYGGDKQKMGQAMMDLYKKEGVNPLGGCLPMLAQMPFFLAFYWVLIETVELRHSPFLFWINDLSAKDPLFILPLLNAAGMYYSQKLTPSPPNADPMQVQMMKYFPLVFALIFAWFPAGLVLYWLINMLVTLLQQWWYYRKEGGSVFGSGET